MRELDAQFLVLRVQVRGEPAHRRDLRVLPETGALGRDAAVGQDGRGLDDREGCPAVREGAEVHEVEIGEVAVICGVGAHGCHPWEEVEVSIR